MDDVKDFDVVDDGVNSVSSALRSFNDKERLFVVIDMSNRTRRELMRKM